MGFEHEEENCFPGCGHMEDDRNYCKHGNYVGSWAGPDFLCGYCESGISDEEFADMQRAHGVFVSTHRRAMMLKDVLIERMRSGNYSDEYLTKHFDRILRFL